MPLLEQQEMFVPPPKRRIIVPEGCGGWFGVDPSTRRVAIAWITNGGERGVMTESFPEIDGAGRLNAIYNLTRHLAVSIPLFPGLVMVEQPSGKQNNPALSYAVGVVLAAIFAALGPNPTIETCTSSWWKKRATGKGNIYKPKKGEPEYGVLTWARENGYAGVSWDEADAWGIAEAARREVLLEVR